jgi:L-asparaginase II
MSNPVLVEVSRGGAVESRHQGAAVVMDADGSVVFSIGDIARAVFPRSAVKALQVLPLIESGVADRFGLTDAEIALCCSSHSGEPAHVAGSASMLAKAGRDSGCLECGAHWPMNETASRDLAISGGKPSALHNNCSGKHSGFICLACGLDEDPAGYIKAGHRVQREIRGVLEEMTDAAHRDDLMGTDGCSIPTYAVPLASLALAFARFGAGVGMGPKRKAAIERVRKAVAANPFMVAGTGRFDTVAMTALGGRAFTKTGAEAVFCGALPELGLGIALKIDDGGTRASEAVMATLMQRFLKAEDEAGAVLGRLAGPTLRNWNGVEVGAVRVAPF